MIMNTSLLLTDVLRTLDEIGRRTKLKKTEYCIREMKALSQYLTFRLESVKYEERTKMTATPSSIRYSLDFINKRLHDLECKMLPTPLPEAREEEGSTAFYYELPEDAKELQDIISYLDCNAQMGEIGRAWMRYGKCDHSPKLRDINKIIFYATEEKKRILKYEQ